MSHHPAKVAKLLDQLQERLDWVSTAPSEQFCNRHARIAQGIANQLRDALGLPPGKYSR